MLFEQAEMIERMPREERHQFEARLQEIKVGLIRTMISDQLAYLNIARKWFTGGDLREIHQRKVGYGKIGGKSAGMMLAYRIISDTAPPEVREAHPDPCLLFFGIGSFLHLHGCQRSGALGGSKVQDRSVDALRVPADCA